MVSRSEMRINKCAVRLPEVARSIFFKSVTQPEIVNIPIIYRVIIWSILILSISCGAPNVPGADKQENYFFATIGTKKVMFSGKPYAKLSIDKKRLEIGGMIGDNDAVSDGLEITLQSLDTISSGSYKSSLIQGLTARYALQNISEGIVMGTTLYEVVQKNPEAGSEIFKLNVAAINETRVNGTFSGYLQFAGGTDIIKIKDGSFSLPVNQTTN